MQIATASPIGQAPGSAAQRQALALQTGRVIGNRSLARLIGGPAAPSAPAIQRGPGMATTAAVANVLVSKQMMDEAIANSEALQAIQSEISGLTPKDEAEDKAMGRRGGEETGDRREKLVAAIGSLRSRIATEVIPEKLGGNEGLAKAIRRRFNLQMAVVTPFYTQWWNANILGTKKNPARLRTCNVSTIAMVLEGLGKTAADFNGSHELMDAIAGSVGEKTPAVDLRFPDFLQILAIYLQMPGHKAALASTAGTDPDGFKEKLGAASTAAHGAILDSGNFNAFTSKFGVSVENVDPDLQKGLAVIGGYYRPMEKDFEKFLSDKGKAGAKGSEKQKLHEQFIKGRKAGYRWRGQQAGKRAAKSQAELEQIEKDIDLTRAQLAEIEAAAEDSAAGDAGKRKIELESKLKELEGVRGEKLKSIAEDQLEQAASEAVASKTDESAEVEEALPLEVYKNAFLPVMENLLGAGAQVIVILHNHFVKLQAVGEEGIIIHDPGGQKGANKHLTWEQAREHGYFKRYKIVR